MFRVLALLVALSAPAWGQSYRLSFRADAGWFNHGYQDREYLTNNRVTFGVPYGAMGAEWRGEDADGNVLVWGLAQTTVAAGRTYNWDRWETQDGLALQWASVSVGKDYGWWELDLGVGGLIHARNAPALVYRNADGTTDVVQEAGWVWNRRESFTVVTGLFRLFPEDAPHLVVSVARGPLSLAENFMHVRGVLPLGDSRLDTEIGFSSPLGLVFHGRGVLRSNERISVGWQWGREVTLGLRAGLLLRPLMDGSGDVDLWHRLSLAADWSIGTD